MSPIKHNKADQHTSNGQLSCQKHMASIMSPKWPMHLVFKIYAFNEDFPNEGS